MNNEKKRFYLIAGLIFVFLIVAAIVATYLNNRNKINSSINGSNLVNIIGPNIKFAKITPDGQYIYYFSTIDLKFYRYQISNQENTTLSQAIPAPTEVIWSPKFDKIFLRIIYQKNNFESARSPFVDPKYSNDDPTNWLIDLSSGKISGLNQGIQELDWSQNGNQIVYNYLDTSNNSISISDTNGQNFQKLFDLDRTIYYMGAGINYLSDQQVLYYPLIDEETGSNIYIYDLGTKKTQSIIDNNTASMVILSPDKKKIFCNIYSNLSYIPTIIDLKTKQKTTIQISNVPYIAWAEDSQSLLGIGANKYNFNISQAGLDGKIKKTYTNSAVNIEQIFAPTDGSGIYIASDNSIYKLKSSKK